MQKLVLALILATELITTCNAQESLADKSKSIKEFGLKPPKYSMERSKRHVEHRKARAIHWYHKKVEGDA